MTLRWRFGEHRASKELVSRWQGEKERLGAFLADLQCMACHAFPVFLAAIQEEMTLHAFLHGLTPTHLHEHIHLTSPRSLSTTLEDAERAEGILCDDHTHPRSSQRGCCVREDGGGKRTCWVQGGPR